MARLSSNAAPLSLQQARNLHLAAQGLLARPSRRARKGDVFAAIERMRVLQIDTINVVARSPYLVLFSRLGAYKLQWLDELLAEARIFECWAHEACFAPFADFELHRRHTLEGRKHWSMRVAQRTLAAHAEGVRGLLEHIRSNGAVKAAEFERQDGVGGGGWWGWKDEKRWLEALFAHGELMIARRDNFQRVYDVAERVVATASRHATAMPVGDHATMRRAFVFGAVRALGIARSRWINDYFRSGGKMKDVELDGYVEAGELLRVDVEGWPTPGYVHPDHAALLAAASAGRLRATRDVLLSPFDPLVWDRERAAQFFDFDYRIECYTPASKRRFGYFVLPLLCHGRLVGRIDAKAHRADGVFEVKKLFLEEGQNADALLARRAATAIRDCADWHGTPRVRLGRCEPGAFRRELASVLADAR